MAAQGQYFGAGLEEHSRRLESQLSRYLEGKVALSRGYHEFVAGIYDSILEFVGRGGKRMASYTTSLVAKGYGVDRNEGLDAACEAVELYRHAILIHDDLVDRDDLRRGRPTIHRRYSELRDERLGLGSAVFSGNILYCLALERILDSSCDGALEIGAELVRANMEVNESQALELYMEGMPPDVQTWRTMASKRASSLFRATLRIGAIVAGERGDLEKLGNAGEELGYLFDIQDDIIDTLASRDDYGRSPGSDLRTLKRPLHIILAMQKATPEERRVLETPGADLDRVREIVRGTGALEEAWAFAEGCGSRAMELVDRTGMSRQAKAEFQSLLAYMRQSLSWYS